MPYKEIDRELLQPLLDSVRGSPLQSAKLTGNNFRISVVRPISHIITQVSGLLAYWPYYIAVYLNGRDFQLNGTGSKRPRLLFSFRPIKLCVTKHF